VKRRVEHRHLRNAGAEQLARGVDALEVGRVVERREIDAPADLLEHRTVDRHRVRELLAAAAGGSDSEARPGTGASPDTSQRSSASRAARWSRIGSA